MRMTGRSEFALTSSDNFGKYAFETNSSASSAPPTNTKYRSKGIFSATLHPRERTDPTLNWGWRYWFLGPRGQRNDEVTASSPKLNVAGRNRRTFCLAGVDVDEADLHASKGLPASHVDRVVNHTRAVS